MYGFTYHRPDSIEAAVALLKETEDPKLLAGGMTLLPTLKQRLAAPSDVIDLSSIPGLVGICRSGKELVVGAMTCHADVNGSPQVKRMIPALSVLAGSIADPAVRHRGTIGGSLANADPASDYPAAVLALRARIETNERTIPGEDFNLDLFETALGSTEILTAVRFQIPDSACYLKFRHPASGYPVAGVMIARFDDEVLVAVTGAAPKVFRLPQAEAALRKQFSPDAIRSIDIPSEDLIDDIHFSAEYRAHIVGVLVRRGVASLQGIASGDAECNSLQGARSHVPTCRPED